jgi:putative transcriptional regulator
MLALCVGRRDVREARVNNRLRDLRGQREWSQARLAEALDVSRQTVNAIETGKYDPSLPLAFKIGKVFALPIESIFSASREA